MMAVVPLRRMPATVGSISLRSFHRVACSRASVVKAKGSSVGTLSMAPVMAATFSVSSSAEAARVSTSSTQLSGPMVFRNAGMPGVWSTLRTPARSISSTAETLPWALRICTASQARAIFV